MYNKSYFKFISLFLVFLTLTSTLYAGKATTFQELMDPAVLPNAQFGMEVESVTLKGGILVAQTTGARMQWDLAAGKILFEQKIGHQRVILCVETAPIATEPVITHTGPGLGFVDFSSPDMELRINGDSLFMFHVHEPVQFVVRRKILPAFHAHYEKSNHLVLDEWGGFGLYCSDNKLDVGFNPHTEEGAVTGTYDLPTGEILWIGICPPKPFDWKKSFEDQVVWYWEDPVAYPPDDMMDRWASNGNIYLLQREVVLWKDWNLAFEPRFGMKEWNRVRDKTHKQGKKFMVYTSPSYFYTDSKYESHAFNIYGPNIGYTPAPMLPDGENIDAFLAEITKVMTELKPDGLYFDSQYFDNTAATYRLARESRRIVGENGLLEWHSTLALGSNWSGMMYLPQADAYVDYLLRGELFEGNFYNPKYMRYFISCYNFSNSIGHLCMTYQKVTDEQGQLIADNNIRLHKWWMWVDDPNLGDQFQKNYRSRITPALKDRVDKLADQRQEVFKSVWPAIVAERKSIEQLPSYSSAVFEDQFKSIEGWDKKFSLRNTYPFSIHWGNALRVKAHGDTYAYLQKDKSLPERIQAVEVRIKHSSDKGRAWGPSAALQWDRYNIIKIGTRADGKLAAKINQDEYLLGTFDKGKWINIRARWGQYFGVVESSTDRINWKQELLFEHNGTYYSRKPLHLFAGKVPPLCEPNDHSSPGKKGKCLIDYVRLY